MFILYIRASLEGTRGSLCGFFYSLQGKLHNKFKNKNFVNSYRMEAMLTLGAYVKMFYYVGLKMRFPIIFV